MRLGLIARCEYARGLAIQSKGFFDHMPVDKVLLVRYPPNLLDCEEEPDWYPGAQHITYDGRLHQLPEDEARAFLEGLDVVFTVETPYDWRLPTWAREMGVRTVIQGNPEFYRHDQEEHSHQAHPDAWWWPTPWRIERLPVGPVIPVPMPDDPPARDAHDPIFGDQVLKVLHVAGKRAYGDRNGTDPFIDSLRAITEPCIVTIQGFGWELPEIPKPMGSPIDLVVDHVGPRDRWSMYHDQSVLVLPRRYGGLCLPALEAAACGLGVLMPDVSPNEVLASRFLSGRYERPLRLAAGVVTLADVSHTEIARHIDELARNPEEVERMQQRSRQMVPRWSEMRAVYLEELERVCQR